MQPLKALVQIRPPMISELELRLPSGVDRRVTTAVLTLGGGGGIKRKTSKFFLGPVHSVCKKIFLVFNNNVSAPEGKIGNKMQACNVYTEVTELE